MIKYKKKFLIRDEKGEIKECNDILPIKELLDWKKIREKYENTYNIYEKFIVGEFDIPFFLHEESFINWKDLNLDVNERVKKCEHKNVFTSNSCCCSTEYCGSLEEYCPDCGIFICECECELSNIISNVPNRILTKQKGWKNEISYYV